MKLKELIQRTDRKGNLKLDRAYAQLGNLIRELAARELPDEIIEAINQEIDELNAIPDAGRQLRNQIRKRQSSIVRLLEKELKLVVKNHYRNAWMAIGMGAFGIPFGAAFGASMGNMAFLGIGIPIGMTIGMAIGAGMDTKAFKEGRQLDIELKY